MNFAGIKPLRGFDLHQRQQCQDLPVERLELNRLVFQHECLILQVDIAQVLKDVRWNRKKAAQKLDISYKTLLMKIKETGLDNA